MKRKHSFTSTEESFDILMSREGSKLENGTDKKSEDERDNDDGEVNVSEPTTLRMLWTKCESSDEEFVESCRAVGLLRERRECVRCGSDGAVCRSHGALDGVVWRCSECDDERGVREHSWCDGLPLPLKSLVPLIYCWTRDYPVSLTAHEIGAELSVVHSIYSKCESVADDYFNNPVSCIGGLMEEIYIDVLNSKFGPVLAGSETKCGKNYFFRVLSDCGRDCLVSGIVDCVSAGSRVCLGPSVPCLDSEALSYLSSWEIYTSPVPSSPPAFPLHEFEALTHPSDLLKTLFRKRIEGFQDPFLYFMAVIASVYHHD